MREWVWLLWDLVAVGIFIYFIYTGAAHGLIRAVVSFLGYLAAVFVARSGSAYAADFLYERVVRDALRLVLTRRFEEVLAEGGAAAGEMLHAIPDSLLRIMGEDAADQAASAAGLQVGPLVETLIDSALREPVLSLLQGIAFLFLFSLTLLIVRRLARLFTAVYRIPVLGTLNTLLGGVLGVLEAALALFILALAVHLIIVFSGGGASWINSQVLGDTYVFRVFYRMVGGL